MMEIDFRSIYRSLGRFQVKKSIQGEIWIPEAGDGANDGECCRGWWRPQMIWTWVLEYQGRDTWISKNRRSQNTAGIANWIRGCKVVNRNSEKQYHYTFYKPIDLSSSNSLSQWESLGNMTYFRYDIMRQTTIWNQC